MSNKRNILIGILISISLVFIYKLYDIQLATDKYKKLALNHSLLKITEFPSRGVIYDRHKELIVYNDAFYDLLVFPNQTTNTDTALVCKILGIALNDYPVYMQRAKKNALELKRDNSKDGSGTFVKYLDKSIADKFIESQYLFPGFFVVKRNERKYKTTSGAHILGYLSQVNRRMMKNDPYYQLGDMAGKTGIEYAYDSILRGKKGMSFYLRSKKQKRIAKYEDGVLDYDAISGHDLTLSIDLALQEYGSKLLANKRGSIVAIEPSTGEILALVNMPEYDPSLLIGKDRNKNFNTLYRDKKIPLYNRAIRGRYPPGSIFKTAMALIGRQEGVLNVGTLYPCHGGFRLGRLTVGCHSHASPLNLTQSITKSCNSYYCHVFRSVVDNPKYESISSSFKQWQTHLESFGFNKKTGIDIYGEKGGLIPGPERFDKRYGKNKWKSSYIISLSIGQGEVLLTPLQMANLATIIANKGYWITPHLTKGYINDSAFISQTYEKHKTTINSLYFEAIIDGMAGVTHPGGTAAGSRIPGMTIYSKTGTSQNPHGKDHSVYMGFTPRKNPKIAVAVIVENGGYGATYAAPIANLMMEKYLHRDSVTKALYLQKRMMESKLD